MARGTYIFTQPTSGYFLFNGLTYSSGAFTLAATVPLIYQSTPYVSYTGIGVLPSGGSESSSVNMITSARFSFSVMVRPARSLALARSDTRSASRHRWPSRTPAATSAP